MSRVFTRGGGRGGTGGTPSGNSSTVGVSVGRGNPRAPAPVNASTAAQREWKGSDQENTELKESASASSLNVPVNNISNNSQQQHTINHQQQHSGNHQQQQQPPQQQQSLQQGPSSQRQPARQIYTAKPGRNSDKNRSSSGNFNGPEHGGSSRDRDGQGRQSGHNKQGHNIQRDHQRKQQQSRQPGGQLGDQQAHRNFQDPLSSRETSSIDTTENDDGGIHLPRDMIGDVELRENHHPQFLKMSPGLSGPIQGQGPNRREHNNNKDGGRGVQDKRDREESMQKPRVDRQPMNVHQNSFNEPFVKSVEDLERETELSFGRYKNGHMGNMLPTHPAHVFDDPMMYPPKQRYFPVGMGDMAHPDKSMAERGFDPQTHDSGDIFSKEMFWRGPEREEKRDVFMRDEPSPPVIGKSLIWSNQTSAAPLPHPHPSESPHFRPIGSGFGMDHAGFPSNLLAASSPSMMESQHMDSVGLHQRMMHQQHMPPMNQFLTAAQMPDRMHPSGMNDRIPAMFSQPPPGVQQFNNPIRMGFHQHQQFSDAFIQQPLGRDAGRMSQQPQLQQSNTFIPPGNLNMGPLQSPRSPQTLSHEKKWGSWEDQPPTPEVLPTPPPPPPPQKLEPPEIFSEFKCPVLRGPKSFDNLCTQAEELRKAIQEYLAEFTQTPHKERLRRVFFLCFTFWNAIRDAILLDNVQACDKTRELDQMMWREGFYPIFDLLRTLTGKSTGKHDAVGIEEAIRVFLGRGLKFYIDLIPKVLHPFGGSATAQTLVNALTAKAPMADHLVVSLQLAERLMTHLGDLYRYQADLSGSDGSELNQAKEAYQKACLLSPFNGQPHGMLALVAKRQNRPLDIAFHAMRALSARLPYANATHYLNSLWTSVEKTYENKYRADERPPNWNDVSLNELSKRFQLTFLVIHSSLYLGRFAAETQRIQGAQFLAMLETTLNHPLPLGFRDVLLQMTAINIYRVSVIQSDSPSHTFLMDLSFNMFDIVLARLLKIFESAPDLDSAAHLEDTTILSPVVKIFVEWMKNSYQKWFPLAPSLLTAPRDTKRTSMWSRLVSLVNLSLTLNVAGVSEERFHDSTAEKLYEDLFLAGMMHVHPTLCLFYRESKLHEAIAEPRFRFRKMQPLGQVMLSVSPPIARLQWNRFLPTDGYLDKNVKVLWAPLEPPPAQRTEPLPTVEPRGREQPSVIPFQVERPDTARWKPAQAPVNPAVEQNWPSLGQSTKLLTDERRERARTASTNSTGTDEGGSRSARNGDSAAASEIMRNNVEPWWLMDKRLRSNDASNQLKLNGPESTERKPTVRLEESSKRYYLVDTNCLIDYLDRIEKKLNENDDLVVLIPAIVYRELWKLHEKKLFKAHTALSFITDTMDHSKGKILVITAKTDSIQRSQLAKRELVMERGSNDDIIIRTCLTLAEKGLVNEDDKDRRQAEPGSSWIGSLLLLTSDANMRLKARKENICCRLVSDVLA